MRITEIHMEPYNKLVHGELRTFDNTKLVALNTCPTWGVVRYEQHRTFLAGGRAMALEAGKASHEAYAAIRIADLWWNGEQFYDGKVDAKAAATSRARSLFGEDRTVQLFDVLRGGEDMERAITLTALEALATSGYYEDPNDRKRTIANIEEALIAYVSRYPLGKTMPIVQDGFVGVEIPIDMYLRITTDDGEVYEFRFVGRVDGLHFKDKVSRTICVEENKTSSRLDDAWRLAFTMSHQPTGYCLAASAILKQPVTDAVIRGMAIPLPKTFDYGGIVNEPITRGPLKFAEWAAWIVHTHNITKDFINDPLHAPKYTHSCNRYFRPCSLIPFCDSDYDERELMLEEMAIEEWSPLEDGNA